MQPGNHERGGNGPGGSRRGFGRGFGCGPGELGASSETSKTRPAEEKTTDEDIQTLNTIHVKRWLRTTHLSPHPI